MTNNQSKEKTIDIYAFTTRKCVNGLSIIKNGRFKVTLRAAIKSHTKGSLILNGKPLPIESSDHINNLTPREIDENSCLLLFEADSALKYAAIVNDITEVTTVAHGFT